MTKPTKSIVISFRLSPTIIAKAIDGLKAYDKSADITKLSQIVKQSALHGINYLTHTLPLEPSQESQIIVHNLTTQGKHKAGFEQTIIGQPLKGLKVIDGQEVKVYTHNKTSIPIPQAVHNEPQTGSTKSIVTDFSIPPEMLDDKENP